MNVGCALYVDALATVCLELIIGRKLNMYMEANKLCSNSCYFSLILQVGPDLAAVAAQPGLWVHPGCCGRAAVPAAAWLGCAYVTRENLQLDVVFSVKNE